VHYDGGCAARASRLLALWRLLANAVDDLFSARGGGSEGCDRVRGCADWEDAWYVCMLVDRGLVGVGSWKETIYQWDCSELLLTGAGKLQLPSMAR
jgi:hypothetical protein